MTEQITADVNVQGPKGVGGWLLFLCVVLTIISPLFAVVGTLSGLEDTEHLFGMYPGFAAMMRIEAVLALVMAALSIYAGLLLWGVKPGAVQKAKRILLVFIGLSAITAVTSFMSDLPSGFNDEVVISGIMTLVRTGVFVAIWHSYLSKSRRVAATYVD